jgi:hypothetical protein
LPNGWTKQKKHGQRSGERHALQATQLISRIHTTLKVEISIRSLFETGTVAELAERLDEAEKARPAIRRAPRPVEVSH